MISLKLLEIIGVLFTFFVGSFFHFTYDLSGENYFVALFSAVNESTWEHMKLFFYPYLLYAVMEYTLVGKSYPCYLTAKCAGTIVGLCAIPLIFYLYTAALGYNYFVFDILLFLIAVIFAYITSYQLLNVTRQIIVPTYCSFAAN
ncbi:MAG: DUF6512 family protein [Lachnospiraceae bacterium]|nr:DUF6512 family protein [Lachnospiraceae bacterium]